MFHVFFSDGQLVAVDTGSPNSLAEVEYMLSRSGWKGGNYYGSTAKTAEQAILEASKNLSLSDDEFNKLAGQLEKLNLKRNPLLNGDELSKLSGQLKQIIPQRNPSGN
jgi:hypothetical protein